MVKKSQNTCFALLAVIFTVVTILSWAWYFKAAQQKDTVNIHEAFPMEIGEWVGKEIPISEDDYQILENRNAFIRMYRNPAGQWVMFFLNYSQTNRKAAHPPEICFSGGGATFTDRERITVEAGKGEEIAFNHVLVDFPRYQQVMYYTFKSGEEFIPGYLRQQINVVLKTVGKGAPSSSLIRLTTTIRNGDKKAANRLIESFFRDIYPLLKDLP
ncbi:MAG: exosortase C-terminal domain/associated protein EpsI [Candidatus Omnitrophota bacterium]